MTKVRLRLLSQSAALFAVHIGIYSFRVRISGYFVALVHRAIHLASLNLYILLYSTLEP